VPIADTVTAVQAALDPAEDDLVHGLRRELSRIGGVTIPPDAFHRDAIPGHLRPRFRVTDDEGGVVAEGDDLTALKATIVDAARSVIATGRHPLERTELEAWSIGELPQVVEVGEPGHKAKAYPALVDRGDTVSVQLLATPDEQAIEMWPGTCRLLILTLGAPTGPLRALITEEAKHAIRLGPYPSIADWADDCLMAAAGQILTAAGGPPWDATGFDRLRSLAEDELGNAAESVGRDSIALLESLGSVEGLLEPLSDRFPDVTDDVVAQANRLVYPGFLRNIGTARVADVHRYLQAMAARLERLPRDPARDTDLIARVHRLEEQHDRLLETLPTTPELIEVAWMLEELRVSFFAQSLGTKGKVSERRIERALEALLA
jgi:ATP-dependent helicase HrpA